MALLVSLLATAARVDAATRTWDGGGADTNWSTPANWSSDTLPVAGDTVTFNATSTKNATIDVPVTVAIFQINAGYTGTITQSNTLTLTTSFAQSAGTFMGGGAAIGITGALTVNAGGAFTSTSGTLTVTGAVTLAAGAFAHNSGTVAFSTSNVTLNLGGAATFNNIQFVSGTKTIAAGNTLTVLGALTLTAGSVNTGTLAAQGDIATASGFTGGTATLLIDGSGAQLWTGAAIATSNLPIVNINKPGGTLTMTGTLRTTRNWTWTAGAVDAAGSSVTFAGSPTISGSHTLGAVEVRGGALTIAAGTTLTASGAVNLFSGSLNTGTLAAQGDIDAQIGYTGGGTATLLINGTGAQTFTGFHTSLTGSLPHVNIDKPSGTLTIGGTLRTARNWTYTGGALTAGGSTLVFNGSPTISGSHTLGAVEVRGGALTIAAGTTLTASGAVNLFSGSLNTGTLAAQGDIDAQIGYTGGGTATLLINGTGAQTFTGFHTSLTGSLPHVNIDKPSGTLTIGGTLRTARNWTYTGGALTAGGSTLVFNGSPTISGSHTLGAVEVRGGALTIAAGTTLTASGAVNLFSGSLNTGTLAAQGDIDAQIGYTGGGTATLLINGTGAQTFTGFHTSLTGSLPHVNIDKPSGTLTIGGTLRTARNWTYTGGALTAGGSTLVFNGSPTISGSHTLGAVEVRGGALTIAAGTTLTASGAVNLFSGSLNTGTLAAQGDIDAQIGYTGGGTATLLINGTGAQTFTGFHTSLTGSLPHVNIDKPSGTLTIGGTLRTARNWTYTGGALTAGGSTLVFNGSPTISGSHTLGAVEVRGGALTIAAGTTLTASGAVNLFSGSLNTGTLAAQGDIDAQIGYTGGGTATLLINGTGAQTFTGFHTSLTGSLPHVNIDKPSGTLTIGGTLRTARNWTYTGGALTAGGSTLVFNGTLTITGDHSLDAVELHAGTVTVAPGDTLTVSGLLTLTDGNLNGGTLEAHGDIVLQAPFDGETGTIRVAGTVDQTWTGAANNFSSDLPSVVIDKPSGTLFLVGTIRITTAAWTWLNGVVDPGASTIYFDTTVTIAGTHSLFNVYLSGGAHTVAGGDTLTALGLLTLDNGTINGGTIAATGPISQLPTFDGGSGRLEVTGTADQTFSGTASFAAGNLPDLEISKAGGTLILSGTIRSTNDWTHVAGAVDPDGSTVVFAGALAVDAAGMSFNDLRVAGGTATLTSDLIVAGDLTVAAGRLAIGSKTISVAGDVTIDASLTVTTGTLALDGLGGQVLGGAASIGLYDLTVNDPTGVTQTTSVSVAGTLDLVGPLDFSGETLNIAHAITGSPNDLTADATATLVISGTGSGIVIPSSLTTLLNLSISNLNGVALAGPLTVEGTFTLGGGNLDAGSDVLSIGPAGVVIRITGHVVGALQKWVASGSGVSRTYEIGDASVYAPVALTFGSVGVAGQLTAATTPGEHPDIGTSPILATQDVNRWWALANAGVVFSSLDAVFTFAPSDVDPGAQTSAFIVGKWDSTWTAPTSGANTATSITAYGMTSLSDFAIGEGAADLIVGKAGPAFATAGDPGGFNYVLTVHNSGPSDDLAGFTVADLLPAGLTFLEVGSDARCIATGQDVTCTNTTGLAAGADDAFVLHVRLDATVFAGTVLVNSAVVTATNDPDSLNNASSTLTEVRESAAPRLIVPTPTASLADTTAFALDGARSPVMLLSVIAAWILLLAALAAESAWRRR